MHYSYMKIVIFRSIWNKEFKIPYIKFYQATDSKSSDFILDSEEMSEHSTAPKSIYDIIQNEVIMKWRRYIQSKTKSKEIRHKTVPRNDTLWKKMLRDMREFYRILFRQRFDQEQFKDQKSANNAVWTLLNELGFETSGDSDTCYKIFHFIHQTHKSTSIKLFKTHCDVTPITPFDVIEKYNEDQLNVFMKDPLCSKMFYFVFFNNFNTYYKVINETYRDKLSAVLQEVLEWYRHMEHKDQIESIENWISQSF